MALGHSRRPAFRTDHLPGRGRLQHSGGFRTGAGLHYASEYFQLDARRTDLGHAVLYLLIVCGADDDHRSV